MRPNNDIKQTQKRFSFVQRIPSIEKSFSTVRKNNMYIKKVQNRDII